MICNNSTEATAKPAEDPVVAGRSISDTVASNKLLLDRIDRERGKTLDTSAQKLSFSINTLIATILRSGDCDRAHTMMLRRDIVPLELYCFAMGFAGRADELPEKTKPFETNATVRRRLKNEECSFEHLCEIPMRHGTALKHVVDNDYKAALVEYQAICKIARFANEYSQIAESIAFEVLQKSGAKPCIAILEELSEGNERRFKVMLHNVSSRNDYAIPQQLANLKQELLPNHVEAFINELRLVLKANTLLNLVEAKQLSAFALSKIPELEQDEAARVGAHLISSDLIDSEEKDRLSPVCFQWLQTKPKGDHRAVLGAINPWLFANGKTGQLKTLALQYDGKDRSKYTTVIRRAMDEAKYDFPDLMDELVSFLPAPEEVRSSYGVQAQIANILIESNRFELAEQWLEHVKKDKNILTAKLELYRDLIAQKRLAPKVFFAGVEKLIKKANVSEVEFYSKIRKDFLAEIASRHGVKVAFKIARQLPDKAVSRVSSRANELVSALLRRKRFDDVLLVAEFITQEELEERAFALRVDMASLNPDPKWMDQFWRKFQGNRHILHRRIRKAIADGDKAQALQVLQLRLETFGECTSEFSFVFAGWEDECYKAVMRASGHRADSSLAWDTLSSISDGLCLMRSNRAAIDFIDKKVETPIERLRLYGALENEYLGNSSTTIWTND